MGPISLYLFLMTAQAPTFIDLPYIHVGARKGSVTWVWNGAQFCHGGDRA